MSTPRDHYHRWTTADELGFLARIGTHCGMKAGGNSYGHAAALRQYRDTMHVRREWGEVDRERVRGWIESELREREQAQ